MVSSTAFIDLGGASEFRHGGDQGVIEQAAVIEMDVEKETVDAKEVEGIGLPPPKDKAEAVERIKTNAVYYRQNYLIATWAYALINCVMPRHFGANPVEVLLLLGTGGAILCASDSVLFEL